MGTADVSMTASNSVGGGEIHYTVDGSEPADQSPVYTSPFTVKKTTAINAALFRGGKQAGCVSRVIFDMKDVVGSIYPDDK